MKKRKRKKFNIMSKFFLDPSKAGECFDILDEVKDCVLFNKLEELLDEVTIESGQALIENLVRNFGDQHSNSEFLQLLLKKCFFNIFGSEHVSCILNQLSGDISGDKTLKDSSVKLLLIIISNLPSLVRGLEQQLCCLLLQEDIPFNEELIQMIAKAGPYISYKLSFIKSALCKDLDLDLLTDLCALQLWVGKFLITSGKASGGEIIAALFSVLLSGLGKTWILLMRAFQHFRQGETNRRLHLELKKA